MKFYCFFIFLSAFTISSSQNIYDFPLDIPVKLSGSFAELRSNHFHAGIDIKTKGKEGYKIYAIDSGYVSRIQVSAGGYGKAIYITHMRRWKLAEDYFSMWTCQEALFQHCLLLN